MNKATFIPVLAWRIDECPSCNAPMAILETADGPTVRLRLSDGDADLLRRIRHPAYMAHLRPMLEELSEGSLGLEIKAEGLGTATGWVFAITDGRVSYGHVSLAFVLLAQAGANLPLCVDSTLVNNSQTDHYDELIAAFSEFVGTVSPQDFERFEAGTV